MKKVKKVEKKVELDQDKFGDQSDYLKAKKELEAKK